MTLSLKWVIVFLKNTHLGEVPINRTKPYGISRNGYEGSNVGSQLEKIRPCKYTSWKSLLELPVCMDGLVRGTSPRKRVHMTWSFTWILVLCCIHLGEVPINHAETYRVYRSGYGGSDVDKQLEDDKAMHTYKPWAYMY